MVLTDQLQQLDSAGLALNVGGFVGFNSIWQASVGMEDQRPVDTQIREMQGLIEQGLEARAWGVSAGLDYVPGYYAKTEEVIKVLQPFADWQVVFSNHDRLTPESRYSSIAGMTETIEIGMASGLIPLITHMKVQGWEQGVLSLEEAIYKMSGLPAKIIGMPDRGTLEVGQAADIVVFNPETVIDKANYREPTLMSEGIIHTLVNGQFAWRNEVATGIQAGKTLVRPKPF